MTAGLTVNLANPVSAPAEQRPDDQGVIASRARDSRDAIRDHIANLLGFVG